MKKKTNREKFLAAIPEDKSVQAFDVHAHMAALSAGSEWLPLSAAVALRVQELLKRGEGRSQKWLAQQMDVSEQQVSKILRGQENLTLSTIAKLQKALGAEVMNVPQKVSRAEAPAVSKMPLKGRRKAGAVVIHKQTPFDSAIVVVKNKTIRRLASTPRFYWNEA
jgi:plasmid maintenance system antidote protein VapI